VIVEAEMRLSVGNYARAVSDAYHRVVLDLQKAYGLSLPAQWTHREFLSEFLREDMGILTTRVARLYQLYEPVRYGTATDRPSGDLLDLLHQIYDEPPMRDLYLRSPAAPPRNGGKVGGAPSNAPNVEDLPPRPDR
jgi:hypothetical protein